MTRTAAQRTVLISSIPPPPPFDFWTGDVYDVINLQQLSGALMAEPDPMPGNEVGWLETFNEATALEALPRPRYVTCFKWLDLEAFGWVPTVTPTTMTRYRLAPHQVEADTLRDLADYLAVFIPLPQNTLANLVALNGYTADQHLSEGQLGSLLIWFWAPNVPTLLHPAVVNGVTAVSVVIEVSRASMAYLRMAQRNDGWGVARHPRLSGAGSNNPSSAHRSIRLGTNNRYL